MHSSHGVGALSLHRTYAALATAQATPDPGQRYLACHLAALQGAAVVLAAAGGRELVGGGPRCPWPVLARAAPELGEWAAYFAVTDGKREAIRLGGRHIVSGREADDLLRDVERFTAIVEGWLVAHSRRQTAERPGAVPPNAG